MEIESRMKSAANRRRGPFVLRKETERKLKESERAWGGGALKRRTERERERERERASGAVREGGGGKRGASHNGTKTSLNQQDTPPL
jgi:hypothetical protein